METNVKFYNILHLRLFCKKVGFLWNWFVVNENTH